MLKCGWTILDNWCWGKSGFIILNGLGVQSSSFLLSISFQGLRPERAESVGDTTLGGEIKDGKAVKVVVSISVGPATLAGFVGSVPDTFDGNWFGGKAAFSISESWSP